MKTLVNKFGIFFFLMQNDMIKLKEGRVNPTYSSNIFEGNNVPFQQKTVKIKKKIVILFNLQRHLKITTTYMVEVNR